jgi:hypothetical protein
MKVTLLVPGLFRSRQIAPGPDAEPGAPAPNPMRTLGLVLGRANAASETRATFEATLLQAFGIASAPDVPVAPYTAAQDGVDASDGVWLRADPIHLHAGRDRLLPIAIAPGAVSLDEARSLAGALDRHWAGHGLQFVGPTPARWYVRSTLPTRVTTRPLTECLGREAVGSLPEGPDARAWHRVINESQMVLHDHPVNEARSARGAVPVNSVWIWGAGSYRSASRTPAQWVVATDPLTLGLVASASATGVSRIAVAGGEMLPWPGLAGDGLIVCTDLLDAFAMGNAAAWRMAIAALERNWLAPLVAALRSGALAGIDLVAPDGMRAHRLALDRRALWRFWRRARRPDTFDAGPPEPTPRAA